MLNKVQLIGNLGNDPEINQLPSGGSVANISLATTRRWKDKQTGERKEVTDWHRVIFFNRLAEVVGEYLKKGSLIHIEGRIQNRKWKDDSGQDRYTTEIVASEMLMLGSKGDSNPSQQQANQQRPAQQAPQGNQNTPHSDNDFDGDKIPF